MELIYEGTIKKEWENHKRFEVRKLVLEDLIDILQVQEQIVQHLNDNGVLQPLTKEEFQYILGGNGLMIGAFVCKELIAFRALLVPPIDEDHLGRDIGLTENELSNVIYQEISNVLPAYRGNKLQQTLATLIMKELNNHGSPYRYVCCTVAPFNIPSLKDKFAQGMEIAALKEKYGGQMRYVFVKELSVVDASHWQEIQFIEMKDITAQQEILAKGWRGFKMEEQEGKQLVYYGSKHTS
ncbi:GNAT family N-acetyltransferase [Peribacillus simplex]|uniref:GNAT family N-acetyltransferase n=1 Tax=Peribacillus simplex TaxID=1478 RepID=UPI000F641E67|nr:GNAT family N-acetyltransferase [Peribacillus simplex]RRN67209.1 GNAT family N-acetyltransferase [Peribacillus simplex]